MKKVAFRLSAVTCAMMVLCVIEVIIGYRANHIQTISINEAYQDATFWVYVRAEDKQYSFILEDPNGNEYYFVPVDGDYCFQYVDVENPTQGVWTTKIKKVLRIPTFEVGVWKR